MNTGAEAVETAIKLARRWGYANRGIAEDRARIITCAGNFHGRTTTIISFSTEESAREGFGPFMPGFDIVEFGDPQALEAAITDDTAAFLVEPIQGERGVVIPPDGYLREVRRICSEAGILMIADEIQSGLGRVGTLLACDHEDVTPDVLILGKALGGGMMPVSVVATTRDIISAFTPARTAAPSVATRSRARSVKSGARDRPGGEVQRGLGTAGDAHARQRCAAPDLVRCLRHPRTGPVDRHSTSSRSFATAREICERLLAEGRAVQGCARADRAPGSASDDLRGAIWTGRSTDSIRVLR
jgi:ornithine--oxo-acid transaminase